MKNILYTSLVLLTILSFTACNSDPNVDVVAEVEGTAGLIINVSNNSSGALLGSPESGVDLDEASITFSDDYLNLVVTEVSGGFESGDVNRIEIYKSLNGDNEIKIGEATALPFSLSYINIEEFMEGTGKLSSDLRIGDVFVFSVKVVKNDGTIYTYSSNLGNFAIAINCSYDLTGTYTMTNTVCASEVDVEITQNSDGTWFASTADGGLLQFCTTNTSLQNFGSFAVSCGGIVDASGTAGGPDYCEGGDYGIGCITGGTWDQETGVLEMIHNDAFFGIGEYTSKYVRK
ncbi:hypothetical protein [uncultured Formosa sp.]|uniref:hypothetical protein n=1 Tax=uncultured Formosa sp. TaxID=255435 RepID=UPI0026310F96|nr:hypothetical protein [uncultured Formosa sp.]